jgi:hypothetical protein
MELFFFRFGTLSELRSFYFYVSFIAVIVVFYKVKTVCFNMSLPYPVCNGKKKVASALCTIFQSSLQSTSFRVLFGSCDGELSHSLPGTNVRVW